MLCGRRKWSFRNGSMRSIAGIDRRRFLLASAAPLALIGQAKRQRAAAISPLEFKKRLRGPILSAPTVYNADRKSTRLNSSHSQISYAVFCLKKKKQKHQITIQ